MNIHPGHIRLAVTLYHAQEFPAVPLIKTGVVGHQIGRRDSLGTQILHRYIQQLSGDALTAVTFLRVHGADIGSQIGPIMEIILNDTQTADDLVVIQTEKPAQFGFLLQVGFHALQISFLGNAPLAVEPRCSLIHQFRFFPQSNVLIFFHLYTHDAIVDEETFFRVQELRKNKRRPARTGKSNMFSGVVRCADCGEKLYYCTSKNFEARQDHFICSTTRRRGPETCTSHFIRAVVLEEGTLRHMQLVISCIASHEDAFRKALGAKRNAEVRKELSAKRRMLQKSENRLVELDRLFKRIYEDMVNGKLSEARFQMLADDYEKEQAELREKIDILEEEIGQQEDQTENVDKFIRQAKKYLHLEKLTPAVLNDLVKAVYVHAPDNSSGHRVQDVEISYNYIGILPATLLYDLQNGKTA